MSLFNALFSTALFKASQDKFNRDKKKAQQTAYDNVGKKMRRAKKNNQYILIISQIFDLSIVFF